MLDETHALSDITYRLNFILPDQCRSNELVNLCIIIKPLELLCGEEYKTLNGGLEEKGIPNARDQLREEICSSSSHLVHEIIFAVPVRKLASTTHISTQVCDQNGGSARRVKAGKTTGKTGRRVVRASERPLCMECKSLASSDILSRNASMADMAMQCAGRCESEGVVGFVLCGSELEKMAR